MALRQLPGILLPTPYLGHRRADEFVHLTVTAGQDPEIPGRHALLHSARIGRGLEVRLQLEQALALCPGDLPCGVGVSLLPFLHDGEDVLDVSVDVRVAQGCRARLLPTAHPATLGRPLLGLRWLSEGPIPWL